MQVEYSPFTLDIEDPKIGLLAAARELGVQVVAYSPLGRGLLTGQYVRSLSHPYYASMVLNINLCRNPQTTLKMMISGRQSRGAFTFPCFFPFAPGTHSIMHN